MHLPSAISPKFENSLSRLVSSIEYGKSATKFEQLKVDINKADERKIQCVPYRFGE